MKINIYLQQDKMDCGPTCLRMLAAHYGSNFNLQKLRNLSQFSRVGVSLLGIAEAAEGIGFRATEVKINVAQINEVVLPIIIHWGQYHFEDILHYQKNIVAFSETSRLMKEIDKIELE